MMMMMITEKHIACYCVIVCEVRLTLDGGESFLDPLPIEAVFTFSSAVHNLVQEPFSKLPLSFTSCSQLIREDLVKGKLSLAR